MAYQCSFVDNVNYGPEDVNEVVGDLVGAGVAPFISKDSYKPSDLNSLTAGMVSSGVQLGGCKVSRVSDTVVSVAPGIIYFGNGLRLKVTEEHSITVPKNTAVSIVANYHTSTGEGRLIYTTGAAASKSNTMIPLARISADGTITDAREFAESKIVTLGTNAIYSIPEEKITTYSYVNNSPDGYYKIAEIDLTGVNLNKFNYLIYKYADCTYTSYDLVEGYWNFKEDTEKIFFDKEYGSNLVKITRDFDKMLIYSDKYNNTVLYADRASELSEQIKRGKSYFKLI